MIATYQRFKRHGKSNIGIVRPVHPKWNDIYRNILKLFASANIDIHEITEKDIQRIQKNQWLLIPSLNEYCLMQALCRSVLSK